MKTLSWTHVDKSSWADGPWKSEPDKLQWADEITGLPCLIKRNCVGALCGYVGIPEGHPWYRKGYEAVQPYPEVHGGLTYADHCQDGDDDAKTICHIPAPREPDNVWWLGFDCAHVGDLSPAFGRRFSDRDTYRPVSYVQAECASLARQAKEAAS